MTDNFYEAPKTTAEPLADPPRSHSLPVLLVIGFLYIPGVLGLSLSVAMLAIAALAVVLGSWRDDATGLFLLICFALFSISLGVITLARNLYRGNPSAKPFGVMVLALGTAIGLILMLFLGLSGLILAVPSLVGLCIISILYTEDYCSTQTAPPSPRPEATRLDARAK